MDNGERQQPYKFLKLSKEIFKNVSTLYHINTKYLIPTMGFIGFQKKVVVLPYPVQQVYDF